MDHVKITRPVDDRGRIILPQEFLSELGIIPEQTRLQVSVIADRLRVTLSDKGGVTLDSLNRLVLPQGWIPEDKSSSAIWKAGNALYLCPQDIPVIDINDLYRTWFFTETDSLNRIRLPKWFCGIEPDSRLTGRVDTQKKAVVLNRTDRQDGNIKLDGLNRMMIPQSWAVFLGIAKGTVCRVWKDRDELWIKKCEVFVVD